MTQQEDEHEQEIAELKAKYEKEMDKLNDMICDKKTDCDNLARDKKTAEEEKMRLSKGKDEADAKRIEMERL